MYKNSKIFIAGHKGMVGSAIARCFEKNGYTNILKRTHNQLELTDQNQTYNFFRIEKPEFVIIAAAKVGGIMANDTYKAEFIYENLQIQNNIIHSAHKVGVKKLLFLGSACIYPRLAKQPIKEQYLLSGHLEPTNEFYAIAKIAGIKLCQGYFEQFGQNFFSLMPNNLYGVNDNFDFETSHVLPALLRKMHEGKINNIDKIEIWGTGRPMREFLYVDDLADAVLHIIKNVDAKEIYDMGISHVNIGSGSDLSIKDLANLIKEIVGYKGTLFFNINKPDGMPRKLLDNSIINKLGWKAKISLDDGLKMVYEWYKNKK